MADLYQMVYFLQGRKYHIEESNQSFVTLHLLDINMKILLQLVFDF